MKTKRDANGNVIYCKITTGLNAGIEIWFEYDEDGNCIYERNSDGYEAHWTFQEGCLTGYSNSNGINKQWEVDNTQPIVITKEEYNAKSIR